MGQIITRADAEKELAALIRADKRRRKLGQTGLGMSAVKFRCDNANQMRKFAQNWRTRGDMEKAVQVALSARAQLIISRGLAKYLTK